MFFLQSFGGFITRYALDDMCPPMQDLLSHAYHGFSLDREQDVSGATLFSLTKKNIMAAFFERDLSNVEILTIGYHIDGLHSPDIAKILHNVAADKYTVYTITKQWWEHSKKSFRRKLQTMGKIK